MALTRAQLLVGDTGTGTPKLSGQVQGVRQGVGVIILNDGTINFDASTATGVMRLNNPNAYNSYFWPTLTGAPAAGTVLSSDGTGAVNWSEIGLGLAVTGSTIKVSILCQTGAPVAGNSKMQAIDGSLYWDNTLGLLFIRYNDGNTTQWVQVIPSGGGGGGTGTVTSVGLEPAATQPGIAVTGAASPITGAGTYYVAIDLTTLPPIP